MNTESLQYIISSAFRVSLITLVNNVMLLYGIGRILKRRQPLTLMIILIILKNFGCTILLENILAYFYPDAVWQFILNSVTLVVLFAAYIIVTYWTFEEEWLRLLVSMITVEIFLGFFSVGISAVINVLEGRENIWVYWDEFMPLDLVNVALVSICFVFFFHVFCNPIKKLINRFLKHRKIMWCLVIFFLMNGFTSWMDNKYFEIVAYFWIIWFCMLIAAVIYMVYRYICLTRQKKELLSVQTVCWKYIMAFY